MRIGLKYYANYLNAKETTVRVFEILEKRGVTVEYLPFKLVSDLPEIPHEGLLETLRPLDILFSIGGDGTFLSSARLACYADIPVFGINAGRFGFLTEITADELDESIERILAGDYRLEERRMIGASFTTDGKSWEYLGLNDIVIHRQALSRIVTLETFFDNEHVATYEGDGLIISTPTGSTAYNLSAGGSIVHPDVDCIILTPICPHTLNVRPMIVPPDSKLKVVPRFSGIESQVNITFDGQRSGDIPDEIPIEIAYSDLRCRLVRLKNENFFSHLRQKLHWGAFIR
jgi:NAD+ kinase